MLKTWSFLKDRLVKLYPPVEKDIKSLEANLRRAHVCADSCDPEGVGFGVDAAELFLGLINTVEQLRESGVISSRECGDYIGQIEAFCQQQVRDLFLKYSTCVDDKEKEILEGLVEKYGDMSPGCRDMVIRFAMEVRRIGWEDRRT